VIIIEKESKFSSPNCEIYLVAAQDKEGFNINYVDLCNVRLFKMNRYEVKILLFAILSIMHT
jgi:hypothetical protein